MKKVKIRGKDEIQRISAARLGGRLVKTQIPRFGSKFRGTAENCGPYILLVNTCLIWWSCYLL